MAAPLLENDLAPAGGLEDGLAELPDGTSVEGENLGVDSAGSLLLSGPSGPVPVLAGSVFLS